MNFIVTGGAGFIGSNLVGKLLELNHNVFIIDNFCAGKEANLKEYSTNPNLIIYKKDICEDLDDIFKKNRFDAIFHFAALPRVQYSIAEPLKTNHTNTTGTLKLLELCKKYHIKRFIFSSSSSVYGEQKTLPITENMMPLPISPYGLQKLVGEHYCRLYHFLYDVETIALRYFNVYGPKQDPNGDYACLIPKFIEMIKQNLEPLINGDGEQTRDFCYVDDVVNANILAATTINKKCFGNFFNIGTGKNTSVNKITEEIIKLSKNNIKPLYCPAVKEPKNTMADNNKARELLNWQPKTFIEEGLLKTYNFFINNIK